ncbi:MAG: class I SAM-dependent methyltransferase [Candidatus Omnitrophica bacterium]|nr:class I SAM-dependent methyltransferase [Candidatus Omnitrophota bacterium]
MKSAKTRKSAQKAYKEGTDYQFDTQELKLGPWTSYSLINDPKHMCFVLSRYKFCAKMLEGKKRVMEIGSGDGFGLPIIAQTAKKVYAVDWDKRLLRNNAKRLRHIKNVEYLNVDLNKTSPDLRVDGAFLIDVIEHLEPKNENVFISNIVRCLNVNGVLIIGTPNIAASRHATPRSRVQHINLKSMQTLRQTMEKYFENVFMFGMNDEVLHTGFAPMCHYLWAVGAGLRSNAKKVI